MNDRFDLLIFEDAQEEKERRERESKNREKLLEDIEKQGVCEGCKRKVKLYWEDRRTCYSWNKDKDPLEDPNRDLLLCEE